MREKYNGKINAKLTDRAIDGENIMATGKIFFPVGIVTGLLIGGVTGMTVGLMTDKRSKIRKNAQKAIRTMGDLIDQVSDITK